MADLVSASASKDLRTLELEVCRGIDALDPIGHLTWLNYLNIGDCGDFALFAPLANLRHLKELYAYGSTQVASVTCHPLRA